MRDIQVLVDSCADLTGEYLEQYGIDYVCMNTIFHGEEIPATLTWERYSPQELYNTIRGGERVTTTQVHTDVFHDTFEKYLKAGKDIIYIACCERQSGSINTGRVIAKELLESYPEAQIRIIDSLNSSIGHGVLAMYAVTLIREGKNIDEVEQTILGLRKRVNECVAVSSLEWLHKAGRVKASKAFLGNLMGVKPLLISDADGNQAAYGKAKGRAASLRAIVDMAAERIENAEMQTVFLCHADCREEELEQVRQMVREKIPCKDIVTLYIGPIIGASVGPDTIGLWFFGKEVTWRPGEGK